MNKKAFLAVFVVFALAVHVSAISLGSISITKFDDKNGNGKQNCGEKRAAGSFTIVGPNGYSNTVSITASQSKVTVKVPYGTYTITENVRAGYMSTTRNPQTVTVRKGCGSNVKLSFGTKVDSIPAEKKLTAENLNRCFSLKHTWLFTDTTTTDCTECIHLKNVWYSEINPPVGPGEMLYYNYAVEGETGVIPRFEYRLNQTNYVSVGCKSFPELNAMLECGLIPVPGYTYHTC